MKGERPSLVLGAGERWTGRDAGAPEVVIVFDGKAWSPQDLPSQFDLSKAAVVSYERTKVRFFDFATMSGGYYVRKVSDERQ